jgi:signal transduction histidine kinase/phage shock protein PspC (stress-responsive transcriptional regulator)
MADPPAACHHGRSPPKEDRTATQAQASQRAAWTFPRSPTNRVVAGVAGGLAERLGVEAILVRMGFAVLALAGGAGLVLYVVAWACSVEPDGRVVVVGRSRSRSSGRKTLALGLVVLGTLLLMREVGLWFGDGVVWPVALAAAGSAVIGSRGGGRDGRQLSPVEALFTSRVSVARIAVGGFLVAAGMVLVLIGSQALASAGGVLLAMVVTAVGLGLIVGPWIYRMGRELDVEGRARARSEARAEMAAHLHDSVLHTLALIQRADAPPEVIGLARRQERELRAWLYGPPRQQPQGSLRAAAEAIAARVEPLHDVPVEVVVVGDAPLDERGRALLEACQEAAVNAARHSGASQVSVYVEVEPDALTAFVRDEGKGFDPERVPPDRRGIADSIRGRMQRHGGSATILSTPGEGTEVQLRMPRTAA